MNEVDQYINARAELMVERLKRLVRQPTISATGEGMAAGAALVADFARECGLEARPIQGPGHPLVFGSALRGAASKTLLITTHFDVQPAEPLDRWQTSPFELTLGPDGLLVGRGSTDAKGAVVDILT